jgi:hypothetical protein
VLIELEGEGVDLTLELSQSAGEPVALLAEGLRHRHHGVDELVFAVVGVWDVAHRRALRRKVADQTARRMPLPCVAQNA